MASEWRPLGEFVTLASGNTPSKSNPEYWGGKVPWVSAKDMSDFWLEDSEDHLTALGAENASRIVPAGTVLMLARGMTLHNRVPICRVARDVAFNQDVKAVLPKEGLNARFLPYLLIGNHHRLHERVDSAGHGTGRLNTDEILSLPVFVPSKAEQAEIAVIGEGLDKRIHNLRQTNATLQAIAAALFKSRFVDFDDVPPEDKQESELGLIPKGWRTYTFGEIATLGKGTVNPAARSQSLFSHYSLPAFDAGQMPIAETGEAIKSNKTPVPSGAVLVSKLNPHIPRIWFVGEAGENAVCSTEFLVWTPKPGLGSAFVYFVATSPEFNAAMRQLVTGTSNSHQRVRPEQLAQAHAVIASEASIAAFDEAAAPLLRKIVHNRQQAATLAALRDTLLPRLISGQLRMSQ